MPKLENVEADIAMVAHRIAIEYAVNDESSLSDAVRDEGTLYHIIEASKNAEDVMFQAARIMYGIANFHPFVEGNKRTAWLMAMYVLDHISVESMGREQVFNEFVRNMASGRYTELDIVAFFKQYGRAVSQESGNRTSESRLRYVAELHSDLLRMLSG